VDGLEPGLCQFWPSSDGKLGAPKSVTVSAIGIKMHLPRNFGVLQGEELDGGVFDMHRIVLGLNDERWRSFLGDVNLGIGCKDLFRKRQVARINDYRKIGTAANLVGVIDRIVESLFEVSAESRRQVRSRRESEDTDALRIKVPPAGA